MTGVRIGHYQLEELLGRGGMGEVYRAYDTRRNRRVALKLLSTELADDPDYRARFRLESDAVAQLNEPHVIPVHDYGEIDGRLFIDMRLVEGVDLGRLLAEHGPMAPSRAIDIVGQVAGALDAAHSANLVHRDVKPTNVLITGYQDRDFAYLVDFGVAYAVDSPHHVVTRTGIAIGTVAYMAPERFDGVPVDRRVDVYALACLLHECLTASRPFTGDSFTALMRAHLYEPPPRPSSLRPGIPAALDEVVARGMAKVPGDRYATAGELAGAARMALTTPPPSYDDTLRAGTLGPGAFRPGILPAGTPRATPGGPPFLPPGPPPFPADPAPSPGPVRPAGFPPPRSRIGRNVAIVLGLVGLVTVGVLAEVLITRPTPPLEPGSSVSLPPGTTPPADPLTSDYTAAQLFTTPENGTCDPAELSSYSITSYDTEVLGCRNEGDDFYRYFYKYSGVDPDGWVAEIQYDRSNYRYENLEFSRSDRCYDIYTGTYTDAEGTVSNSVLYVFRRVPFVAEVGAAVDVADLATLTAAMFYWTDTAALC